MRDDPQGAGLRDYVAVVRRRKWLILQAVVLVPLAAVLFSLHEQKKYEASAQVLLSSQNLAATLTGTQQTGVVLQPDRIAQTQADVARVPAVARRAVTRVPDSGLTVSEFLADSSVTTNANADVLGFHVTNADPRLAARLVNAYASAYTVYRRRLDTASITTALAGVKDRLRGFISRKDRSSPLYASLLDRQQTLQTMQALETSNAAVVQQASGAAQVQPRTTRNGILGLALGLVLGIGLAFLWEALDTRVRTADQIGARLRLPLLARLPAPPRQLQARGRLVMLSDPHSPSAEAFRVLRTNLEFARLHRKSRSIMVTSATEEEGKTTTIANLAVAFALAGQRVALVDLDLRRPSVHRFFDIAGEGLTQVALGLADLDELLRPIALANAPDGAELHDWNGSGNGNGHGQGDVRGLLEVLPSGPVPPDPGEFVGSQAVADVLAQLSKRAEIVLVDAPPVLHVGDALTLSALVDALFVVTRMKVVRRPMLDETRRLLEAAPAHKLGFVVTAAREEEGYGQGYGYGYGYRYATPRSGSLEVSAGERSDSGR